MMAEGQGLLRERGRERRTLTGGIASGYGSRRTVNLISCKKFKPTIPIRQLCKS